MGVRDQRTRKRTGRSATGRYSCWRHAGRVGLAFRTMITDPQSSDLDERLRRSQIKQRQLKRRIKELLGEG